MNDQTAVWKASRQGGCLQCCILISKASMNSFCRVWWTYGSTGAVKVRVKGWRNGGRSIYISVSLMLKERGKKTTSGEKLATKTFHNKLLKVLSNEFLGLHFSKHEFLLEDMWPSYLMIGKPCDQITHRFVLGWFKVKLPA